MRARLFITLFIALSCAACDCDRSAKSPAGEASLIESIQAAIAAADPTAESYYASTYRREEPKYWTRIAGWIVEDSIYRRFIDNTPANTVLDLGCGYGTLLAFAAVTYSAPGLCYDVIPYIQPDIQRRYGIRYDKLDIERDPFPKDLQVDVVLMTEVIEHLNFHPRYTLKKIYAALKPGGAFFLSTPDADKGWGRVFTYYKSLDEMPPPNPAAAWIDGHIWQYTEAELRQVLQEAGFIIKRMAHAPGAVGRHFNVWATKPPARIDPAAVQN